MTRPVVLTCGDPAGVGTEIALKAAVRTGTQTPFFMLADQDHVAQMATVLGLEYCVLDRIEDFDPERPELAVLHHSFPAPARPGVTHIENASAIISVIETAVSLVRSGVASAVCTNPINKKVLQDGADFPYPGHTEFLAHLGGVDRSVMMLFAPELRVVPVTIHVALDQVKQMLTPDLLSQTIKIAHKSMIEDFGIRAPRIAVAGLNPHAGEGGAMGHEEITLIDPVIHSLRQQGMDITDAQSADTMFHATARDTYDLAICMYHDQALIPLKTLNFSGGVNATLGLPFVRTSPDHGTAYNIAGQGIADPDSLIAALQAAHSMAEKRSGHATDVT